LSLKRYAILLKALGLAVLLVPLFIGSFGYISTIPQFGIILFITIGLILLMAGNVYEAKALRVRK
jgi:hypothetical protein